MRKIVSYIILIVGLAVMALSFAEVRTYLKLTLPSGITEMYLIIAGIALILVGGFMLSRGRRRHSGGEVPIYHGGQIVGYRRG